MFTKQFSRQFRKQFSRGATGEFTEYFTGQFTRQLSKHLTKQGKSKFFVFASALTLGPVFATGIAQSQIQSNDLEKSNLTLPSTQLIQLDDEALYFLESKAHTDPHAQLLLGIAYDHGIGVQRDDRAASSWYMKAAGAGDENALIHLLVFAASGRQSREAPLDRFVNDFVRIASATGNSDHSNPDHSKAKRELQSNMTKRELQNDLGELYLTGRMSNVIDCEAAVTWFRKAADAGLAQAQFNLGNLYRNGRGVAQNLSEARRWYARAAAQGLASAQNEMGVTAETPAEALAWFQKAAAHGYTPAMNNLGVLYVQGRGVAQDLVKAVAWYQKAADLGSAAAQNNLGYAYLLGRGVALNDAAALAWFEKSAWQGHASAALNLGEMYATGRGGASDPMQAYAWLRFAQMKNQPVPQEMIENLKSKLSSDDLSRSIDMSNKLLENSD